MAGSVTFTEGMTYEEFAAQLTPDQLNARRAFEAAFFARFKGRDKVSSIAGRLVAAHESEFATITPKQAFERYGMMAMPCHCDSPSCTGWLWTAAMPGVYPMSATGGLREAS
jgi:hypothetical protein